jgi:hypothetical protein
LPAAAHETLAVARGQLAEPELNRNVLRKRHIAAHIAATAPGTPPGFYQAIEGDPVQPGVEIGKQDRPRIKN